jgi:hypothetical protein
MAGLIKEAQELLSEEEDADPSVLDAALTTAAQKVEHYEISSYGSARTFAHTLDLKKDTWTYRGSRLSWREEDRTIIAGDAFMTTDQESAYAVAVQKPAMHGPPKYFTPTG